MKHPAATFFAKVEGQSMKGAGINSGDIIVIDRALEPKNGDIVVICLNGEFTMRYIDLTKRDKGIIVLLPDNDKDEPISVKFDDDQIIWGVICNVIKKFR